MAFSEETIRQRFYIYAKGQCECERTTHPHSGRCPERLEWAKKGCPSTGSTKGHWEAHHRVAVASGGDDSLSNCEILCCDCHAKVRRP